MVRFLQILLALFAARLVWRVVRALFSRPAGRTAGRTAGPPPTRAGGAELRGRVVGCERCDLHVPEERAVIRDGRTFCSEACASQPGG